MFSTLFSYLWGRSPLATTILGCAVVFLTWIWALNPLLTLVNTAASTIFWALGWVGTVGVSLLLFFVIRVLIQKYVSYRKSLYRKAQDEISKSK